jgi:hypothetical protein
MNFRCNNGQCVRGDESNWFDGDPTCGGLCGYYEFDGKECVLTKEGNGFKTLKECQDNIRVPIQPVNPPAKPPKTNPSTKQPEKPTVVIKVSYNNIDGECKPTERSDGEYLDDKCTIKNVIAKNNAAIFAIGIFFLLAIIILIIILIKTKKM